MKLYLHNTTTNKRSSAYSLEYQVLSYDAETQKGVVTNLHTPEKSRVKFETDLSKETLLKNNWKLSKKSYAEIKAEADT